MTAVIPVTACSDESGSTAVITVITMVAAIYQLVTACSNNSNPQ